MINRAVNPPDSPAPCPACGSFERSAFLPVDDFEYRVGYLASYASCSKCQSVYQVPMPTPETLASFYPASYHSMLPRGRLSRLRNRLRLRRLRALIPSNSTVLDYGCGAGTVLLEASEVLPDVRFFGYEIGERRQITNLKHGSVTIIQGSVSDLLDALPPCELITMNHVIEHLPDPFSVVSALFEKLVPGGALEGQTPAAGCWEQRVFKSCWSGYHAPRHTVIFSPAALGMFLKKTGFDRVEIVPAFNPASMAVSLASTAKKKGSGKVERQGIAWLFWLGLATVAAPLDLLSGAPAIMNFLAVKKR
jgi:SAM-dependent methyltransferase